MMGKRVRSCFGGIHELFPYFWFTEAVTRHYNEYYIKAINLNALGQAFLKKKIYIHLLFKIFIKAI